MPTTIVIRAHIHVLLCASMSGAIYLITGNREDEVFLREHPDVVPADIPVIRRQLWEIISNEGLTPTLEHTETRTPEALAMQARTARQQTDQHRPFFVNTLGLSADFVERLCTLIPEAQLIRPKDIRTLLPCSPSKNPKVWTKDRLKDAVALYSPDPSKEELFDAPAPAFLYAAYAAKLGKSLLTPQLTTLGTPKPIPLPHLPIAPYVETQAPYSCQVTEDTNTTPTTLRLDFRLKETFDLVTFSHAPAIPLPSLPHDATVVLSGKMPIAVFAIMARSLMAAGQREVAIYTPQQTDDADMVSPALVIAPETAIRYIESFPPDIVPKLLTGLKEQAQNPRQQETIEELRHSLAAGDRRDLDPETFRAYCRVFSASLYAEEHIKKYGHGLVDSNHSLAADMKKRAILTILDNLEHPHKTTASISALGTEYLVFGSLLRQRIRSEEATSQLLAQNKLPHISLEVSEGALPEETLDQVCTWYIANYSDPDFAQKLAEGFRTTNFAASHSHHYSLYYDGEKDGQKSKQMIGYIRFSESSEYPGRRYISNLHIAPEFQAYSLVLPFMEASLEREGPYGAYALHAEPGSAAESLYLKTFHFYQKETNIEYMRTPAGKPVYLNLLFRDGFSQDSSAQ